MDKLKGSISGLDRPKKKKKEEETPYSNRKKRSYYLTKEQIRKVLLLNAEFPDDSMQDIVGRAIEEYYDRVMEEKK